MPAKRNRQESGQPTIASPAVVCIHKVSTCEYTMPRLRSRSPMFGQLFIAISPSVFSRVSFPECFNLFERVLTISGGFAFHFRFEGAVRRYDITNTNKIQARWKTIALEKQNKVSSSEQVIQASNLQPIQPTEIAPKLSPIFLYISCAHHSNWGHHKTISKDVSPSTWDTYEQHHW